MVERYPLLITKQYVLRLDTELIARPHLAERLNQAVDRPLVVITIPAVWVWLDEGDNDLSYFWLHLIAALQQIYPGVGEALTNL